jgi:hypothetical protein
VVTVTSPNLDGAVFRKSRRSGNSGQCVEVADNLPGIVAVRDSKDHDRGTLTFAPEAWSAFLADVKHGDFDVR